MISGSRSYLQRVAVRTTYSKNKSDGTWRAHGRYVARESAVKARVAGFDQTHDVVDVARRLDEWQRAHDERLWKLILSPEFNDRLDLKRLTRELMNQMERDLETRLDWVGVTHSNTEHPHVHVALRGIRDDGRPLSLARAYLQHGIRRHAEELCTTQLGYRTPLDVKEAQWREVSHQRFTSLDRVIARSNPRDGRSSHFTVSAILPERISEHLIIARLQTLERMGMAEAVADSSWLVRSDFEQVLRSMQKSGDRQRVLASHGVPVSDKRLPFQVLSFHRLNTLDGRVLVHGEEEDSGRHYMMLEGTDANIHFVLYTDELEHARARGHLRPGSFVALRKQFENGRPVLDVNDLGDAEALLDNKAHFEEAAKRLRRRGTIPQECWEGWLGRYHTALRAAASVRKQKNLPRRQHR